MGVNYGFERVRFLSPVHSGSRIRAVSVLASIEERRPGQFLHTRDVTIEINGADKPALIATWLFQLNF
jgi:acyl dehydratase